jgi:hypothetical protein
MRYDRCSTYCRKVTSSLTPGVSTMCIFKERMVGNGACKATAASVALLFILAWNAEGALADTVESIIVVHRHGARTPIYNVSGLCGNQKCGQLLPQGADMLHSLGEHLRSVYGSLLPSWYDPRQYQSWADSVDRTIQSSSALIRGLFAYNASLRVFPAPQTEPLDSSPVAWTGFRFAFEEVLLNGPVWSAFQDQYVSDNETLSIMYAVGAEMGISQVCEYTLYGCMAIVGDTLMVARVLGILDQFPIGKEHFPTFERLFNEWASFSNYGYFLEYNHTSMFSEYGYPYAHLAANIANALAAETVDKPFIEWSGHDSTLMPLYVALGETEFSYPCFGEVLVFERFIPTGGDSTPFARARLGRAMQYSATSEHPYNFTWFPLTCMNASGVTYTVEGEGCSAADLQRYVATRQNPSPLGNCYMTEDLLATQNCTSGVSTGTPPSDGSLCALYRSACPFSACNSSLHLSPSLQCVSN